MYLVQISYTPERAASSTENAPRVWWLMLTCTCVIKIEIMLVLSIVCVVRQKY